MSLASSLLFQGRSGPSFIGLHWLGKPTLDVLPFSYLTDNCLEIFITSAKSLHLPHILS